MKYKKLSNVMNAYNVRQRVLLIYDRPAVLHIDCVSGCFVFFGKKRLYANFVLRYKGSYLGTGG